MGKKKFKKNNKKAEQQMESAERISRLMEMYDAGEISDEEFIELMNCKDVADETVRDTEISDMISGALGYDRTSSPSLADVRNRVTSQLRESKTVVTENTDVKDMTYASTKNDSRGDIAELEARVLLEEKKTTSNVSVEDSVEKPREVEKLFQQSPIIPGVTDVHIPYDKEEEPTYDDEFADLFSGEDSDELGDEMPELALVDTDDKVVTLLSRFRGFRASLDLDGGETEESFDPESVGLTKDEFYGYIRNALLMIIGDNDIATTKNVDLNSLITSVKSLDQNRFKIFYIHYDNIDMEPYYVLYDWTPNMEKEFINLMEWLDEENLTTEFTLGILDLVTNHTIFPLLEEPKRSKYITVSDDEDIRIYVNSINSSDTTEFGIIPTIKEFNEECTVGSLDKEINQLFALRDAILEDDDDETESESTEESVEKSVETVVVENVETSSVTVATTEIVTDEEIEIDDVDDASEINLETEKDTTEATGDNRFIVKPIVK